MEGNLRFKIDRASLIVGSKFTVFALFYFVFLLLSPKQLRFSTNFHLHLIDRKFVFTVDLLQ